MKVHLIGIGGIGVSSLAQYYLTQGFEISGSDLVSSEITDALKKLGAKIFIPHQSKLDTGQVGKQKLPDLVIYSPAIQDDNPELKDARNLGIKCLNYPQALGELTKQYRTIAVAGTHGKGTTCAMLSLILIKAGLDPTVIIGTKLKEFGNSNFRAGESKYLLIEADEWRAAFLSYWPEMIILTNIEQEHLDFYQDLKHILDVYRKFVRHLPKNGTLIINENDKNSSKLKAQIGHLAPCNCPAIKQSSRPPQRRAISLRGEQLKIQNYSLKQEEAKKLREILKIPGEHNIANALAALMAARALKIPDKISFKALSQYKGTWRRFEIIKADLRRYQRGLTQKQKRLTIVSDYAHHPTEIEVTLRAARGLFSGNEIWVVFQPHQYQRTFHLFDDFVKVFQGAPVDKLIITDIYDVAGREEKAIKKKVSAEKLVKAIKQKRKSKISPVKDGQERRKSAIYLPFSLPKIANHLKKNLKGGEVVVVMGAGDIYKLVDNLTPNALTKKKRKKIIR